jgi:lipid A ethanolaminephosphotransferase
MSPLQPEKNDSPEVSAPAGPRGFFRPRGGDAPFRLKEPWLIVAISAFMTIAYNRVFFAKVFEIYPLGTRYLLFHAALFVIVGALTVFVFALVGSKYTTKPVAACLFIASSVVSYFVNNYGIVVDDDMLRNVMETNRAESWDLLSVKLGLYVLFLGLVPGLIVWRAPVEYGSLRQASGRKVILAGASLATVLAALFSSASTFASFLREHKSVRAYVNPLGYLYAAGKLMGSGPAASSEKIQPYAEDARRTPGNRRRLVILVVGETARADRFSLNGYGRETNPLLKREDIVNFPNVMSAGTSTGISVPAMFSHLPRKSYDSGVAHRTENILDILARVGVAVLWRDNNSDSKGVAVRVAYEDFKTSARNPVCDEECRDEGMLVDLQDYIDRQAGDVLVVLHQMGSHGPAYYKRYPKAFEVFTPVCQSNQLEQCSQEEINNAYDNSIRYTDYFLSKAIALLKRNDDKFETAMLYFSDHGESLGEHHMYLHGYPYALAPMEQKHIPAVFWFGSRFPVDRARMRAQAGAPYSHDYLFHSLLSLFEVKTSVYNRQLDMVGPFVTSEN